MLKSMKHQIDARKKIDQVESETGLPVIALFMEQGTGKTKVVIDWAVDLWEQGKITGLLVVAAPNGVHINWDEIELPKWADTEYYSNAWEAPSGMSKKKKEAIEKCYSPDGTFKILCMNIEALSHKVPTEAAVRFLKSHIAMMAIDESSWIKNPSAKRTKNIIKKLSPMAHYRAVMTGTPWTNSPLDCYCQMEFLHPSILGMRNYNCFRARYADLLKTDHPLMIAVISKAMGITREKCLALAKAGKIPKGRIPPMISGYKRLDELKSNVDKVSFRVLKEDCTDLPPKIYQMHHLELGKEQRKMYDELAEKLRIEFADGEISATNALTKLLRLQQIVGGFVGLDDLEGDKRKVIAIPDNKRVAALMDLLEAYPGKIIIWARFRAEIQAINEAITAKYGRGSCAMYYGDTSVEERKEIVNEFQGRRPIIKNHTRVGWEAIPEDEQVKYFIGNPHAGGYGITLTAAGTVIYYSNDFSLETRLQSEDRAHRIGQTRHVTYVDMMARKTIDQKIIEALRSKKSLANTMTGDRTTWI